MKIGQYGKWERIKDKPTYDVCWIKYKFKKKKLITKTNLFQITEDNFILSFCHRTPDDPDIIIYYAFTYPFTYTELQNYLEKLDKKFEKRIIDVKQLIKIISQLPKDIKQEIGKKKETQRKEELKTGENILVVESSSSDDTSNSSSDETQPEYIENLINSQTSEQSSCLDKLIENPKENVVENIQDLVGGVDEEECETESYEINQIVDPLNEIYYHRELLICSVEGRRVDLLTISSFHGIQEEQEERLSTLFPETDKMRCQTFENKKVWFD